MAGLAMKIDENTRKEFEAIIDARLEAKLLQFGLINNEHEISREDAEREFSAFLEKGRTSPITSLTTDDFFDV